MTTFTISTPTNFHALTGRTGNDTYNVSSTLTIDRDVRYGENTSTTTGPFGTIAIDTSVGGKLVVDATGIRGIPFSAGTGTVPAPGAVIGQGGVSAILVCVMAGRTGGTISATGAAMPSTGYLKVRALTGGSFVYGPLTGIGALSSGPDETSFLELAGVELAKITMNRLGAAQFLGAMFEVSTTSGARHQLLQLPAQVANTWHPGVWIETAAGSNVFKWWANGNSRWSTTYLAADSRNRMVFIDGTGLLRIGGDGTNLIADLPVAGCRIRVPNIILSSTNATVGYGINSVPHATLSTRYGFNATNGTVEMQYVSSAWNMDFQSLYKATMNYVGALDRIQLVKLSAYSTITQTHTGLGSNVYDGISFLLQACLNGGLISDCSGTRATAGGAGAFSTNIVNCAGWTVNTFRAHFSTTRTISSAALYWNTCTAMAITNLELVGDMVDINAVTNSSLTTVRYADVPVGNTSTGVPVRAMSVRGATSGCTFSDYDNWPGVANVHPYTAFLLTNTVLNSKFRNFGSAAGSVSGGTLNATGIALQDTGNCDTVKHQRMWFSNLRTRLTDFANTSTRIVCENLYGPEGLTTANYALNAITRGIRANATSQLTYTSTYGSHFWDGYVSDTVARATLVFTEKTSDPSTTASYNILSGTPFFMADGSLKMLTAGDQIEWIWNYQILGWTSLNTFGMSNGASANYTYEFDVDAGAGYTGYRTLSNGNLAATAVSPAGFYLKLRITCNTPAPTKSFVNVYVEGSTTLALQNAALRPLDAASVTLTGLQANSEVRAYLGTDPLTAVEIGGVESSGTSFSFTQSNPGSAGYLQVISLGYNALQIPITYSATDVSFPIQQALDRNYLNT